MTQDVTWASVLQFHLFKGLRMLYKYLFASFLWQYSEETKITFSNRRKDWDIDHVYRLNCFISNQNGLLLNLMWAPVCLLGPKGILSSCSHVWCSVSLRFVILGVSSLCQINWPSSTRGLLLIFVSPMATLPSTQYVCDKHLSNEEMHYKDISYYWDDSSSHSR